MGAEHEGIRSVRGNEEMTSGVPVKGGVGVSARRPVRVAALDRVMQDVAGDYAAVADPHADVARVRPSVFVRWTSQVRAVSSATTSTSPASITGRTESTSEVAPADLAMPVSRL